LGAGRVQSTAGRVLMGNDIKTAERKLVVVDRLINTKVFFFPLSLSLSLSLSRGGILVVVVFLKRVILSVINVENDIERKRGGFFSFQPINYSSETRKRAA
jgi:hypothetical protein